MSAVEALRDEAIRGAQDFNPDDYVAETDLVPEFWSFLGGLRSDDLVAELIQNEIDAGATHSVIEFGADGLACFGNGRAVDADGWTRLRYLRGAGDLAPRKRGLIGVKNHGLKACFTLGDDIFIRSGGRRAHQTLYRMGEEKPPLPGASREPVADAGAPAIGCRIEVPYRRRRLRPAVGELPPLDPLTAGRIEQIFRAAVDDVPGRFIGVLRPGKHPAHVLELRHHELGAVRFEFACSRVSRHGALSTFVRTCTGTSPSGLGVVSLRERVFLKTCPRPQSRGREAPLFYEEGAKLLLEVSWPENRAGKALAASGAFRYPIAYAQPGPKSDSGFGVSFSAPFISDTERHGLAEQAFGWNDALVEACDHLLAAAIHHMIYVRDDLRALDVLRAEAAPAGRLERILLLLLEAKALPSVRPSRAREASKRRRLRASRWDCCVVPSFDVTPAELVDEAYKIAPPDARLLARTVPDAVVEVLSSRALPGFGTLYTTFDEADVMNRFRPPGHDGPDYFEWRDEVDWRKALADPTIVNLHLDALVKAHKAGCDINPPADVHLPDARGRLHAISALYASASLPDDLKGVEAPPCLHPQVAAHPIFKLKGWARTPFTLADLLSRLEAGGLDADTARRLFLWVCRNPQRVPPTSWPRLRDLPIWPDESGGPPGKLAKLCLPRSHAVRNVLGDHLRRPNGAAIKVAAALRKRRLNLAFRHTPNVDELTAWLDKQLEGLPRDLPLTSDQRLRFRTFEAQLAALLSDRRTARVLAELACDMPALSVAGVLGSSGSLVRRTKSVERMFLNPQDLIDRAGEALDNVAPPAEKPAASMVRRALREDPENAVALLPRLAALADTVGQTMPELGVSDVPCIPVHGEFHPPAALVFKGNKGNFWGDMRREISGSQLAAVDQKHYLRAGVWSAEPRAESSLAFFVWLNANAEKLATHLPQVLRHFLHDGGVRSWWQQHENLPCLPAERLGETTLISRREATRAGGCCYVNDAPHLADAIARAGLEVWLAVDKHAQVTTPIADVLLEAGVRSLRSAAGEPIEVSGAQAAPGPQWARDVLEALRSDKVARTLQKQLAQLQVPTQLMHVRWQNRLNDISDLQVAAQVRAAYKLGRKTLKAAVAQARDPATGILFLAHADKLGEAAFEDALFEALAARVFVDHAPQWCAAALERALRIDVREAQRARVDTPAGQDDEATPDPVEPPGQAPEAHYNWQPDPKKNLPEPGQLPSHSGRTRSPTGRGSNKSSSRIPVPDERAQIEALKQNEYAWHCQIALAGSTPSALAPEGSYAEHQENRYKLIEAHHPDAVDAGGARHAGNVLILSHLEHHRYGQLISRDQVTEALKSASTTSIVFSANGAETAVQGVIATVLIPTSGEEVPIFFTMAHRDYWLRAAANG